MCEVGIYRISGVSGEIQRLKKAFEKSMTTTFTNFVFFYIKLVDLS